MEEYVVSNFRVTLLFCNDGKVAQAFQWRNFAHESICGGHSYVLDDNLREEPLINDVEKIARKDQSGLILAYSQRPILVNKQPGVAQGSYSKLLEFSTLSLCGRIRFSLHRRAAATLRHRKTVCCTAYCYGPNNGLS